MKAVIKAELDKALPKAQSDALWQKATTKLDGLMTRYGDLPMGVHMHTDSRILPSAAIYLYDDKAVIVLNYKDGTKSEALYCL